MQEDLELCAKIHKTFRAHVPFDAACLVNEHLLDVNESADFALSVTHMKSDPGSAGWQLHVLSVPGVRPFHSSSRSRVLYQQYASIWNLDVEGLPRLHLRFFTIESALDLDQRNVDTSLPIQLSSTSADFTNDALVASLHETAYHYGKTIVKGLTASHFIRGLTLYIHELFDTALSGNRVADVAISLNWVSGTRNISHHTSLSRTEYEMAKKPAQEHRKDLAIPQSVKMRRPNKAKAYIALGSNVGDRLHMIEQACLEMKKENILVKRTSSLYETEAMYVKDQDAFVNGACEVETFLAADELLRRLKAIEDRLGRVKIIDKGPRSIDLDILLFNDERVDLPELQIPHASMFEREFVLRPLCDLIPGRIFPPSRMSKQINVRRMEFRNHLNRIMSSQSQLSPMTPLSPHVARINSTSPQRRTHVMAILNMTPDSFSDGGMHRPDPDYLLPLVRSFKEAGATILDIGGQSSRPNAPDITAEEEVARIVPTIELLRSHLEFRTLVISVDTYRASVAAAAIEAGADIVNDVSAGTMDREMLPTVARLGCSIILGHMRGTPATMTKMTTYEPSLIPAVGLELHERVEAAEEAGIRRWRIMLDPGIGFAKNESQNLEILRDFAKLRDTEGLRGLPWCVGASRKKFIGRITGRDEPKDRAWGSAACSVAAIQGGADIVRVHDVAGISDAAKMADAIWRV
ncbi:trifunctional dihydropteroate synthetase [Agyrium rufum]|nr:trifunctional dihydropteroate synthetase [Agyrium rufum]